MKKKHCGCSNTETPNCNAMLDIAIAIVIAIAIAFIYSNRDVYIAIALCSSLLHSAIAIYTICPADNATAGSLGRRRAGQLRFGFVAVSAGHIVYIGRTIKL
jgi:ethanolamine utilization microcompartment shell protein EutS